MSDAPQGERAVTHARIGNLLYDLRGTVDDLIALRQHPEGAPLVADEEAEICAIKDNLTFLLSDILLSRKLRVVSNG
ncbi:hypothetical protein AB8A05_04060 [Tardiphaga sp. 538_B7_N1_4]|uniref:hypothetical protein n=1 Tax=Tardiphaga sp. 538_B7_N1_4 TaxID=3240778 RepID=UPI003F289620